MVSTVSKDEFGVCKNMAKSNQWLMPIMALAVLLAVDASITNFVIKPSTLATGDGYGTLVETTAGSGVCAGLSGQFFQYETGTSLLMKYTSKDAVGTGVNPTYYVYSPEKYATLTNWANERRFTDSAGTYELTGTAASNVFNVTKVPTSKYYFHASLSGYADGFGDSTVPSCGSMSQSDAQSTGFNTPLTMTQYDTTSWTTSNQSFEVANSNATNTKVVKDLSYTVATNKMVSLSQITVDEVRDFGQEGIRQIRMEITGGSGSGKFDSIIYDYAGGTQKWVYKGSTQPAFYDSYTYSDDDAQLNGGKIFAKAGETFTFRWTVYADIEDQTATVGNGKLSGNATETILYNAILYDQEGNDLLGGATKVSVVST